MIRMISEIGCITIVRIIIKIISRIISSVIYSCISCTIYEIVTYSIRFSIFVKSPGEKYQILASLVQTSTLP